MWAHYRRPHVQTGSGAPTESPLNRKVKVPTSDEKRPEGEADNSTPSKGRQKNTTLASLHTN